MKKTESQSGVADEHEQRIFTDAELASLIDPILEKDDRNKDGFIDYPEFIVAQQSSANVQHHV